MPEPSSEEGNGEERQTQIGSDKKLPIKPESVVQKKRLMSTTLLGKNSDVEDEGPRMRLEKEQIRKIKSKETRRIKSMKTKQATTLFGGEMKNSHKRTERSKSRRNSKGEGNPHSE